MAAKLGRRGLAALGVALIVLDGELDRVPEQLVADVPEGEFSAALGIDAHSGVGAGHHPVAANLDRGALRDAHDTQRVGHRSLRFSEQRMCQQQHCTDEDGARQAPMHGQQDSFVEAPTC